MTFLIANIMIMTMRNDPSGKKLGKAVEVHGPFASGMYDESLIDQVQPKPL